MTADTPSPLTVRVREQLPITVFEHVVLAVRAETGMIYLSLRDLCVALHIDPSSQRRRIQASPLLRQSLVRVHVQTAGGRQEQDFLSLDTFPNWLNQIQIRRVNAVATERLAYVQAYFAQAVRSAFAALTGLPDGPSPLVEDLRDLERIDIATRALEARQQTLETRQEQIETSQDRARGAWRDLAAEIRALTDRVQQLEHQVGSPITTAQRGVIYQMVQNWAAAKAEREPQRPRSAAYQSCWALVRARFKLARYEDLPAARYDECRAFIREAYQSLTGHDLDVSDQHMLGLDDTR